MRTLLPQVLWALGLVVMAGALLALAAGFIYSYQATVAASCSGSGCAGASVPEAGTFWFKAAIWTALAGIALAFAGNLWLEHNKRLVATSPE